MSTDDLNKRMDKQDELLSEIKEAVIKHKTQFEEMKPALDELVSLWKGSKVISSIIAAGCAVGAGLWALIVWAKDHIK